MDQQEQARRTLAETFRRERMEAEIEAAQERGKKRREMPRWVHEHTRLFVGIVVLLLIGLPIAWFVLRLADEFGATDTVKQFCIAAEAQDYKSADSMLSAGARARLSPDQLGAAAHKLGFDRCELAQGGFRLDIQGDSVAVAARFGAGSDSGIGTISLVRENGSWHVAQVDGPFGTLIPA